MLFCRIDNTNTVVEGPRPLPTHGERLLDGARSGNLWNLSLTELRAFGWIPADVVKPVLDRWQHHVLDGVVFDGQVVTCTYNVVDGDLADAKAAYATEVANGAGQWILAHFPEHTQRNMLAKWLELKDAAEGRELTPEESETLVVMRGVWDWVTAVRTTEAGAQADIEAATDLVELRAILVPAWPAYPLTQA